MKIAIPVNDNNLESAVCMTFGRTPFFLIYDMESEESKFIDNSGIMSQGGAGIRAAQVVVDQKVNVLLTPRLGQNAAEVIKAAGIEIYQVKNTYVMDNIKALVNGNLSILNNIHEGFHNHGGH